jgi:hypothetical protein
MTEHELELRLRRVARAVDAEAPALDPALLRAAGRRRRLLLVLAAGAALAGLAGAPAAVSALADLFDVEPVPELGPVAPDVTAPFLGRAATLEEARASLPFRLRTLPSPGSPDVYVRDDIAGGAVILVYAGGIQLMQWPSDRIDARIAVVPVDGKAEDVTAGGLRALWVVGTARGTFTLVGADGTVHKERFEVADGALLWSGAGASFLLQGAGTKERAVELAARVGP